jgi:hypothetical protein
MPSRSILKFHRVVFIAALISSVGLSLAAAAPTVSRAPAAAGAVRNVTLHDPVLNMTAYTLTIPAKWDFESAVVQGSSCLSNPFPVFRALSPDGLTGVKQLPRMDWSWSDNAAVGKGSDCLPYRSEISAEDFLKYMVGVLEVSFVQDDPNPDREAFQRKIAANSGQGFTSKGDLALATVRYHVNKIEIEDHLRVSVSCSIYSRTGSGRVENCSAFITRKFAPRGKFSPDTFYSIDHSLQVDQSWNQEWTSIMVNKMRSADAETGRQVTGAMNEAARLRNAQNSSFEQAQKMRQKQHDDFDATLKRGTDMSMARTQDAMNARSRAADDWCDYSLDLQKRLDPNTGLITKDSSAYNYSWVNEQGDRVQTNNINANPNGNGTGNWTLQENVR